MRYCMLVHTSIRMGKTWLVSPHRPTEAKLGQAGSSFIEYARSNTQGELSTIRLGASRPPKVSDRVTMSLLCSFQLQKGQQISQFQLFQNWYRFWPQKNRLSAQAFVWRQGGQGGQAVRAINRTRKDRVTRIPASMIE